MNKPKNISSAASRDVHEQRQSPEYDPQPIEKSQGTADPDVARQDERAQEAREQAARANADLPPKDARTDPGRGTGELGHSGRDPDMPLRE
jgi:hypothetical protein